MMITEPDKKLLLKAIKQKNTTFMDTIVYAIHQYEDHFSNQDITILRCRYTVNMR